MAHPLGQELIFVAPGFRPNRPRAEGKEDRGEGKESHGAVVTDENSADGANATTAAAGDESTKATAATSGKRNLITTPSSTSTLGTLYTEVAERLVSMGWRHRRKTAGRFHLFLGEAQASKVPFKAVTASHGVKPLFNFFRGFHAICRKAWMLRTLREYASDLAATEEKPECKEENAKEEEKEEQAAEMRFDLSSAMPESFIFTPGKPDRSELGPLAEAHAARIARGERGVWILKPSDGTKGHDIVVMNNLDEIQAFLLARKEGSIAWVIQSYIERPLLLPGERKFDIRCWVLLDASYSIYLYDEGVLRTCSTRFDLDDLSNQFSHLSNHCLQVESEQYGTWEPTNEMFYDAFRAFLSANTSIDLDRDLIPQIEHIVKHSLLSVYDTMHVSVTNNYECFQVFGFDFMSTVDGRVQLIEVNSSPAVAEALQADLVDALVRTAIMSHVAPSDDTDGEDACGHVRASTAEAVGKPVFRCIWRQNAAES